jgi:hypothetical protein
VNALRGQGVDDRQISTFSPESAADVHTVLLSRGSSEGERRFYMQEVEAGRTLVIVLGTDADADSDAVRDILLRHGGYDVQSRGGELARSDGAGVPGGTGPRPIDQTGNWEDVASRYEMLWAQHYGTSEATWEQMAPAYRYAWQAANQPGYRGRPWSEVEALLQADWDATPRGLDWSTAAGPIRDVWEDVAAEAATGAEGGQDRRIPRQGNDQSGPASDLIQPR